MTRWIAVSTDLLNAQHELHPKATGEPACRMGAWIDLIGLAAWRDHGGRKRGEARASVRFLAERWNWQPSKVQRFLEKMERQGAISRETQTGREPARITIRNYDAYQSTRDANSTASGHADRHKEVPVPLPTNNRARARRNGNGRKPPRSIEPEAGPTMKPEKVRDILEGLKKQVGE